MNVRRNNSINREIARIQFEFLRLSPTYELANEILYHHQEDIDFAKLYLLISNLYKPKNGSELTSLQEAELLKSYVAVANLRSIFGDLSKITFDDWWQQIGGWYYGYEHDEASVKLISTLEQGQAGFEKEDLFQKLSHYTEEKRKSEGNPKTLLISIPMGIGKKKILQQISDLVEEHKTPVVPKKGDQNQFVLKRFRIDALLKSLYHLKSWASMEEPVPLWRFAIAVKINPSIAEGLKIDSKPTKSNVDQRNTLAVLMHRSLTEAQYIAENAAHGIFPSRQKCLLPRFDQVAAYARMQSHKSVDKNLTKENPIVQLLDALD